MKEESNNQFMKTEIMCLDFIFRNTKISLSTRDVNNFAKNFGETYELEFILAKTYEIEIPRQLIFLSI